MGDEFLNELSRTKMSRVMAGIKTDIARLHEDVETMFSRISLIMAQGEAASTYLEGLKLMNRFMMTQVRILQLQVDAVIEQLKMLENQERERNNE